MNGSSSSCCPEPTKRKRGDLDLSSDRISLLPRPILHHILSFLGTNDVVRAGILSKTWYHTSTSFPVSDFCQTLVGNPPSGLFTLEEWIHIFLQFVRKSLQSQCRIYGSIPKFKLSSNISLTHTSTIEDCIQLAIQNNVKELDITLRQDRDKARFLMPQTLLSSKELILLTLYGCQLSLPPTHCIPTWPFLLKLRLDHCHIDGHIIQNLTFSCPLLESLFLLYCDGLGDIRLSGSAKLTEFEIDGCNIMVELDVPCLKTFTVYSDFDGGCNVDLTACKNITVLKWSYLNPMFSSQDLTNLIAGLPALESLDLYCEFHRIRFSSQRLEKLRLIADQLLETELTHLIAGLPSLKSLSLDCMCERINFSSQRLEKLELSAMKLMETDLADLIGGLPSLKFLYLQCKLERIEFSSQQLEGLHLSASKLLEVSIDAPSLKTFQCSDTELSSDLFMGRSSPQEVTINFFYDSAISLLKLRKFLRGFKEIKLLKLCCSEHNRFLPAELMDIPLRALPDIKHLRILPGHYLIGPSPVRGDYVALLNGLLWNCRPESMSINFRSYGKFITKVFCEELSEMVKGQHRCKDDDHAKCGCRGLRSFQIKQSRGYGDAGFISCDAFLELLPTLASEAEVHFMLEW